MYSMLKRPVWRTKAPILGILLVIKVSEEKVLVKNRKFEYRASKAGIHGCLYFLFPLFGFSWLERCQAR
jgi:hypothetical protein